jgi:hypothetical protein
LQKRICKKNKIETKENIYEIEKKERQVGISSIFPKFKCNFKHEASKLYT